MPFLCFYASILFYAFFDIGMCCGNVFNGYCYWEILELLSQSQAEERCVDQGGHLVSIHSQEENDFIISIMSSANSGYHIGLHRDRCGGAIHWYDGTRLDFDRGSYSYCDEYCSINSNGDWPCRWDGNSHTYGGGWKYYSICKGVHSFDDVIDCSSSLSPMNDTNLGSDDFVRTIMRNIERLGTGFFLDVGIRVIRGTGVVNVVSRNSIETWDKCDIPSMALGWEKTEYDCYDEFWKKLNFFDDNDVKLVSSGTRVIAQRELWIHSIQTGGICNIISFPEKLELKFDVSINSAISTNQTSTPTQIDEDDQFPITGISLHSVSSISYTDKRLKLMAHLFVLSDIEINAIHKVSGTMDYVLDFDGTKLQFVNGQYYHNFVLTTTSPCPASETNMYVCDSTYTIKADVKHSDGSILPYDYTFEVFYSIPLKDHHVVVHEIPTFSQLFSSSNFLPVEETFEFERKHRIYLHSQSNEFSGVLSLLFKVKESFVGCSPNIAFQCPTYKSAISSSFEVYKSLYTNYQVVEDSLTQVTVEGILDETYMFRFSFLPNFVEDSNVCCVYVMNAYAPSSRRSGVEYYGYSRKSFGIIQSKELSSDDLDNGMVHIFSIFCIFLVFVFLY